MRLFRILWKKGVAFLLIATLVTGTIPLGIAQPLMASAADIDSSSYMKYETNLSGNAYRLSGYVNGAWEQTSYDYGGDFGFTTQITVGSNTETLTSVCNGAENTYDSLGLAVTQSLSLVNNGRYVQVKYTVRNITDSAITMALGSGSDIQIGDLDYAPITEFSDHTGFFMTGSNSDQFNFIGKNAYGVTNVDYYWFGFYGDYQNAIANQTQITTSTTTSSGTYSNSDGIITYNGDSGMAFGWYNRSIAAGSSQTFSVLIGVGAADKSPTVSSDLGSLSITAGGIYTISGTVSDPENTTGTEIYYAVDDRTPELGYTFSGAPGDYSFPASIPSDLTPGTHTLNVFAQDTDGAVSSAQQATFTVPVGEPGINTQPQAASAAAGSTATFTVSAASPDGGTLSYQWQSSSNGIDWSDVSDGSGATSASYTTGELAMSDSGIEYRCVVTNTYSGKAASTTSDAAALTVIKQSPNLSIPTASPSSPQTYPGTVTLSSTLSSYCGTLSGQTVTFWDGETQIGTATTDAYGTAALTWSIPSAGEYNITAKLAGDSSNNDAVSGSLSYNVEKGAQDALSIADPGSKTYGDSPFQLSVSGGSGSGSLSYSSDNTDVLTVDSSGKVTIVGAGSATVTVTKAADSNYNEANQTIPFNIAKKAICAVITPSNKTYDRTAAAEISSIAYDSFAGSDTASDVYLTVSLLTFSDANAGNGKTLTAYGYTLAGNKASDYTLDSVTVEPADIAKAPLTIMGISVSNKTYDGTTEAQFSSMPYLSGILSGDVVTLTDGTPSFESANASDSAKVDFSNFSISGADAGNYSLIQPVVGETTAVINPASLTVSVSPVNILCGQAIPALTVNVTGFVNGENEADLTGFEKPTANQNYGSTTTPVTDADLSVTYSGGSATNNYIFSYPDLDTTKITIQSVSVTADDYQINSTPNEAGWYHDDLIINPSNGYDLISTDGINWASSLTVSTEAAGGSASFLLKKSEDGTQTEAKTITYSLDKTRPSDMTVKICGNAFTSFLHTITFGLFFDNTTDVTLSAADSLSGIDHYMYQLVDTSKGQSYDADGSWISSADGTFSVSPEFKGTVYAYAVDKAGNVSDVVSSNGFIADLQTPGIPTVSAAVGETPYNGDWTSGNVKIVASDSSTLSGIDYYEYKIGDSGAWTKMPGQSGATDAVSGNVISDTLTITSDMSSDIHIRAVSNSGVIGNESVTTVKRDSVVPALHVDVSGTTGQWTEDPVTFTFSNTADTISPVTYWVKADFGDWTQISGSTYTVSENVNTNYQFKAVSASGLTSSASDAYTVKFTSDSLKEVVENIDNLPDPDNASDTQITDNEQTIKDTKILYDTLGKDEQSAVGQSRIEKLNQLIDRLNALLMIISEDTATGVVANNIGTSVKIPELNNPDVGKVVVKLVVNPVTSFAQQGNIALASNSLSDSDKKLLSVYDVSLMKSVFDAVGNQTNSGKISNSDITGPIMIQIPVPDEYQGRTDLQVVYIDDSGNVTPLETTFITVDGVNYLQFTTTHFSMYAVTATTDAAAIPNPQTGSDNWPMIPLALLGTGSACGIVIMKRKENRKDKKENL